MFPPFSFRQTLTAEVGASEWCEPDLFTIRDPQAGKWAAGYMYFAQGPREDGGNVSIHPHVCIHED